MAVFTRINGDAAGQVNVDAGRAFANAAIINTGIAAPLSVLKITTPTGNLAAELTTGGAVETILRVVETNATVLAYQVDATPQISIVLERSGWASDAAVATAITAASTANNISGTGGNVWVAGGGFTVSSAGGLKLA
jgi:hypothetical protein